LPEPLRSRFLALPKTMHDASFVMVYRAAQVKG
jgi:hypothetical protein